MEDTQINIGNWQPENYNKKPFEELFVEPKTWSFKSASSDKEYTVRQNASGKLSCDCWGYIAHRKCKHLKEVSDGRID